MWRSFLRHFLTPLQAINLYGERPYLQPELQEARDFVQATEHSKQLTNAFRADIQKYWDELESARRKLQVLTQSLLYTPVLLHCCGCDFPTPLFTLPCTQMARTGAESLSLRLASTAKPQEKMVSDTLYTHDDIYSVSESCVQSAAAWAAGAGLRGPVHGDC